MGTHCTSLTTFLKVDLNKKLEESTFARSLLSQCDLLCIAAPPAAGAWLSDEEPATEIPVRALPGSAPALLTESLWALQGLSLEEQSHGSLGPRNAPSLSLRTPAARLHRDPHLRPGP